MGPTNSPIKRSQEENLSEEQDIRGRKKRKLKYQKLEDNLGEGDVELVKMRDHTEPLETSSIGSKVPNGGKPQTVFH